MKTVITTERLIEKCKTQKIVSSKEALKIINKLKVDESKTRFKMRDLQRDSNRDIQSLKKKNNILQNIINKLNKEMDDLKNGNAVK